MRLEAAAGWVSICAGAIHAGVAPVHFASWWGYGLFFLAATLAQALFGLLLVTRGLATPKWPWARVRRVLAWVGIMGNLAVIVLWVLTRTVGIPAPGPDAVVREPVGGLDVTATVLEALLVVLLLRLALRPPVEGAPDHGEAGRADSPPAP